ncbi:MAG TPA: hypothetical protein VGN72_09535 [Tepidisphaeraceae bacterium]|jgi:hypothetical protein|nr:hypothetical protein [Tepidisphaeraceae bacterium]
MNLELPARSRRANSPIGMDQFVEAAHWADATLAQVDEYLRDVSGGIVDRFGRPTEGELRVDFDRVWERWEEMVLADYAEADRRLLAVDAARPAAYEHIVTSAEWVIAKRGDAPILLADRAYISALAFCSRVVSFVWSRRPIWRWTITRNKQERLIDTPVTLSEQRGVSFLSRLCNGGVTPSGLRIMRRRVTSEAVATLAAWPNLYGTPVPQEHGVYGAICRVLRERGPLHTEPLLSAAGYTNAKPVLAALVDMGLLVSDRKRGYSLPPRPNVPGLFLPTINWPQLDKHPESQGK